MSGSGAGAVCRWRAPVSDAEAARSRTLLGRALHAVRQAGRCDLDALEDYMQAHGWPERRPGESAEGYLDDGARHVSPEFMAPGRERGGALA